MITIDYTPDLKVEYKADLKAESQTIGFPTNVPVCTQSKSLLSVQFSTNLQLLLP